MMPRTNILKIPTELLHLIFTEVSEYIKLKPRSSGARLCTLRLLCRAFNRAIIPILFAHIVIDVDGRLGPSAVQIEQLSRPHERGSMYRVVRTLEIRTLGVVRPCHARCTRRAQQTSQNHAAIDGGLSTAIAALTGLRDVHWSMSPEDSATRVAGVIKGLCALPPDLELSVGVEYIAGSMDPQLVQLGARLTSLAVVTYRIGTFLHPRNSKDPETLATLVASSPRLDQLHFVRRSVPIGLDGVFLEPTNFDLDALLNVLPPDCRFPPHLVLEELPIHLAGAAHRLRGLQTLVLVDPPVDMDARVNDTWNAPLWNVLGAAGVFPSHIVVSDINPALLTYLERHPGIEALALHTMHDECRRYMPTDDQDALASAFFATALPRHAHSLRNLCVEFVDPGGAVFTAPAIARCVGLETLSVYLEWKGQDHFAKALDNVLLLISAIPGMHRLTFTIELTQDIPTNRQMLRLVNRVNQGVRNVVMSLAPDGETGNVPREILAHGQLFCIGTVEGERRYVDERDFRGD